MSEAKEWCGVYPRRQTVVVMLNVAAMIIRFVRAALVPPLSVGQGLCKRSGIEGLRLQQVEPTAKDRRTRSLGLVRVPRLSGSENLNSGRSERSAAFSEARLSFLAHCRSRGLASCPNDACYGRVSREPGEPTHVVDEIGHSDFGLRPGDADGAHEGAHPCLLFGSDMPRERILDFALSDRRVGSGIGRSLGVSRWIRLVKPCLSRRASFAAER